MKTLRIKDYGPNGCLAFDLRDILSECHEYSNRRWVAFDVDCFGSEWYDVFSQAPDQQVELSFEQLVSYAKNVGQTIDGLFVALKPNSSTIPVLQTLTDYEQISDLVIQAVDSTFFEVCTDDENLISKLRNKFRDVTLTVG